MANALGTDCLYHPHCPSSFFYSKLQIAPDKLAENFQKNGSYIPGIRPGAETERYVVKS